jgi:glycosyltransferase involved in cell wall biosynthesis
MKNKIVHATISPCQNERRIFNQALTASRQGYLVMILALKVPGIEPYTNLGRVLIQRITVKPWKGGPRKFIYFNFKLFWRLLKIDLDIVHAHDLWVLPACALITLFKNKPLIYDAHEFAPGLEVFSMRKISGKIWTATEKIFFGKVDALITINPYHQKLFRKFYPKVPMVQVIYNFPALRDCLPENEILDFQGRSAVVLYQGVFKENRGLRNAVSVMQAVTNGSLQFIGSGELEDELQVFVRKMGLNSRIQFRGEVNWMDLLKESGKVQAGLVLFLPKGLNYRFASPNKFFEYVAAGTPVIASALESFKDFNKMHEVAILVDPDKIEEIAAAVNLLLTDEKMWSRLHANCLIARKEWNWENLEKDLLSVYRKLIGNL